MLFFRKSFSFAVDENFVFSYKYVERECKKESKDDKSVVVIDKSVNKIFQKTNK